MVKGYENTLFGKHAMQKVGVVDVITAIDDRTWKAHKSKGGCNKYKKLGHFARERKTPELIIIQKMTRTSTAQRKQIVLSPEDGKSDCD